VTEQVLFTPDHMVALARRSGSRPDDTLALARGEDPMHSTRSVASNPVIRFLADALRFYMEFHAKFDGFYGAYIHDPLALAAALDPSLVTTEALAVDVETAGSLTTGETVADWRHHWNRPPNVDVAVTADASGFFERFIERVGALAESCA
jgi:purine nucleosidase